MDSIKKFETYSDEAIISKVLAGEKALYEIIIRRYNPYLFKTGRSYGYSHSDTEDLIQETYLSAFKSLDTFENRSSFKTWLIRIMINHCYQKKRKFSFQKEVTSGDMVRESNISMFTQDIFDSEKIILNRELGHVLEKALLELPMDYRMVFSLRILNGMSTKETANSLDISESNVKIRLKRARGMLKSEIEKMYSPQDIFEFNLVYCNRITENVMKLL